MYCRRLHRRLFLLSLLAGWGTSCQAASPPEVEVDFRDGSYRATLKMTVPVPAPLAFEVLTDFEHMAGFVPNLSASRVLARNGGMYRVSQQGKAEYGPFSYAFESVREVDARLEGRLLSRGISGSTRHFRSELAITPQGAACRLDYRVEMTPDEGLLPGAFGVPFVRHELAEQFLALAHEMERRQALQGAGR